ncbi:hypothetical protein IMZ48_36445 [Candidatus Bathyarchaeota archaeon]|nr:hypothetical protein [Candidatus Bathyarchaeota archaeon]
MVVAADSTLSGSTRIFGRLGMIAASIPTTSSALSAGDTSIGLRETSPLPFSPRLVDDDESVKTIGRVVKRAVRSLRKMSCGKS